MITVVFGFDFGDIIILFDILHFPFARRPLPRHWPPAWKPVRAVVADFPCHGFTFSPQRSTFLHQIASQSLTSYTKQP